MEFKYPLNFIWVVLPVTVFIFIILGHAKKHRILGLLSIKMKSKFRVLQTTLFALGLALIFVSLLGPQTFSGFEEVRKEGLDIYVLVDTSKSMLVEDIKPNRMEKAKRIIKEIIDNLKGDRIGFIPFASAAYIQMPLTDDYQLARMFLEVMDTDMIGGGGTNIGAALKLAYSSFEKVSKGEKVIIILSDGEEHDLKSIDALKNIKDEGLRVYTVGVGTEKGGLIPIYDPVGGGMVGYKKDKNGEFVISKMYPSTLKDLSKEGRGAYFQSSSSNDDALSIIKAISSLKRDEFKTRELKRYKQLYQYFLFPGLFLFLVGYFLFERGRVS